MARFTLPDPGWLRIAAKARMAADHLFYITRLDVDKKIVLPI